MLIASTSEVYGKIMPRCHSREDDDLVLGPPSRRAGAYACSKAIDEFLALAYHKEKGLPVVVVRLFNTVGPRQTGRYGMVIPTFVSQALAGEPITVFGDGTQRRCFTDVTDVVDALVKLGPSARGRRQGLSTSATTQEITILDLAELVKELTGSTSEIVMVPYDEAYEEGFEDMRPARAGYYAVTRVDRLRADPWHPANPRERDRRPPSKEGKRFLTEYFSLGTAFLAAAVLTPLVILVARRTGMVCKPKADRWHSRPTALLGGVAIFVAFLAGALPFLDLPNPVIQRMVIGVLIGATLMFVVGLLDDLLQLRPAAKLLGQILAACVLVYAGVYFHIIDMPLLTIPLTVFFVVGITNAFNLLDNMDGLASGVAAICLFSIFFFNQLLDHPQDVGILCLALGGALLGFLIFNFNPAKIFMGDAGSMFIGFTVAAVSILGTWEQASNTFLILVVPVLVLALPIFDTTFVTITRRLSGRPVSQGGKDHTSHRLVRLGLSERHAVLFMYAISLVFAAVAVLSLRVGVFITGIFAILSLIVIFLFGVFLGHDRLYKTVEAGGNGLPAHYRHGTLIGTLVLHKMRLAEMLIDLLLFGTAYVGAFLIRFDGVLTERHLELIVYSLPILVAVKFVCFYGYGLYRQLWEFTGIHDLVVIAKAVVTGSLCSVFALWALTRLEGYSRAVFVLDGILLLILVAGSRVLLRVFHESFNGKNRDGRRLMIYGAGAAGELLLREIRSNPSLGYQPVGFLDDDARKRGGRIHGVRVLGGRESLRQIVTKTPVDEIVIAIPSLDADSQRAIQETCASHGVPCRTMRGVSSTFIN